MREKIIYNCHAHTFTHRNIPDKFLPLWLVPASRNALLRRILSDLLMAAVPWTANDKLDRYAAFVAAAYRTTQEENFRQLAGYYPEGTRFVVLPMDLAYMGAGRVREEIDAQHAELAALAEDPRYHDALIPFAQIDPRRPGALARLQTLVEEHRFSGVKIYPTLGYAPDDEILMNEIYPYMVEHNIPLMAHCSPGSVNSRAISRAKAYALAEPENYRRVMHAFPELRICLGHFGGLHEWRRHINELKDPAHPTWLSKIRDLLISGDYPKLYTDISYTIFNFQENLSLLQVLLTDPRILSQVLFGSDFYMVESERYSEKRLSLDLRAALGEAVFWTIAHDNPLRYLGFAAEKD